MKSLVEEHRKTIGSLPGTGVFVIASPIELKQVLDFYRSHAVSLLKRMCVLGHHNSEYLCGQIGLELDGVDKPERETLPHVDVSDLQRFNEGVEPRNER